MLKVQILDECGYCHGEGYLFAGHDTDTEGKPYPRYRPCGLCEGSGSRPKWVTIEVFAQMLQTHIQLQASTIVE